MKNNIKKTIIDYIFIFLGAALFSVSFNLFIRDTQIAMGGITGISVILFNLFGGKISMGVLTLLVNIPFLLIGIWRIGGKFMIKTIFASVTLSIVMRFTENWLPALSQDTLLCAIFGGLGTGAGIGLVFLRGGSTAGTDIVGIVAKQKFTGVSIGNLVLVADTIIVLLGAWAFQSMDSILFAIIKMYAASIATDAVLYGLATDKLAYIVSEKASELGRLVIEKLGHGATILTGEGAYTNQPRKLLMCAINPNQIGLLKEIVRETDDSAFMIVTNTHEVLGFGFKPNVKSNV